MKNKCDCYHIESKRRHTYHPITGQPIGHDDRVGVCWGTKEIDECSCGGDRAKCDFYPEVRERALRKNNVVEYDFRVGDRVITSTGKVGIIESICDCDQCKARGFYEPSVEAVDGVGSIYITDNDKRVGFRSFYQIGKYKFGNIDKESVEYDIKNETRKIEEAIEDKTTFQRQLNRLDWIESIEETNKEDFYITFDKDGDLYGIPK